MATRNDRAMVELVTSILAAKKTAVRLSKRPLTPDDIHGLTLVATQSAQAAAEANRILGSLTQQKFGDK
jgi:hypothetical protein